MLSTGITSKVLQDGVTRFKPNVYTMHQGLYTTSGPSFNLRELIFHKELRNQYIEHIFESSTYISFVLRVLNIAYDAKSEEKQRSVSMQASVSRKSISKSLKI